MSFKVSLMTAKWRCINHDKDSSVYHVLHPTPSTNMQVRNTLSATSVYTHDFANESKAIKKSISRHNSAERKTRSSLQIPSFFLVPLRFSLAVSSA